MAGQRNAPLQAADPDRAALPLRQVETAKELATAKSEQLGPARQADRSIDAGSETGVPQPTPFFRQVLHVRKLRTRLVRCDGLVEDRKARSVSGVELKAPFRIPIWRQIVDVVLCPDSVELGNPQGAGNDVARRRKLIVGRARKNLQK